MDDGEALDQDFGTHRGHLERMAAQLLGSAEEATEAVETARRWIVRGHGAVEENTAAWLHTVVARTCRDRLRARDGVRRPPPLIEAPLIEPPVSQKAVADSIGVVLMAALERLSPSERLAFVLHDVLGVPLDEIATIIGRSPEDTGRAYRRARRHMHRLDPADLPVDVPPAGGTTA
jgi:RNA polymerase sigma-70 factor (ECF subfamily)